MDSQSQLHIVICPWLAFGHILPCLELADRLASRGHLVSFVSTPRNISRLHAVAPRLNLVALQLPRVDGLPDGAESTSDISQDMVELHWKAADGLAAQFSEFLGASSKMPDWILLDSLHSWAVAVAAKHNVPCGGLLLCAATTMVSGDHRELPKNSYDWRRPVFIQGASGMSVAQRCSVTLAGCKFVALRSCLEWEPESVHQATKHHHASGKPLVTLGLLPPSPRKGHANDDDDAAAAHWLDAQPAKSVVYAALGTEVPLSAEQVRELALGLELAGTRFVWALRRPPGIIPDDADILPPGFQERTRARGLVLTGWAPQLRVLAHGAIAAFLTHCGWSSTIEGLLFGHPLVMLPMVGDQWPNARLMEGREVGVEVTRHGNDGSSFDRNGVATAVRAVTADEGGVFTANAKKLQKIVADKECHERYIDQFIQHLKKDLTRSEAT